MNDCTLAINIINLNFVKIHVQVFHVRNSLMEIESDYFTSDLNYGDSRDENT